MTSARTRKYGPSDLLARAVKQTRTRRGWSAEELAERCRTLGAADMTPAVLANIETGRRGPDGARRRHVTVDELLVLALALDVAPIHLLLPVDNPVTEKVAVTETMSPSLWEARWWIRGQAPLRGQDPRTYFSEVPPDEYHVSLKRRRRHAKTKADIAAVDAELAAYEEPRPASELWDEVDR
jgi:transcriptional regulator with XRE-family HTH domain